MINIVKKYLSKNNYSHLKNDFEGYFLSHPNYPSLFAITDSLEMLAIENVALKILGYFSSCILYDHYGYLNRLIFIAILF